MKPFPFAIALLRWYQTHKRDLPWRGTRDPYLILVSETMLQQTRVEQAKSYFLRFTHRFPNIETLAQASEDEVLKLWQGLGYYARARNLLQAARQITAYGSFPNNYAAIHSLKGVGDYTAAAVASLAFNLPHAVVDGNVFRVLARHFGIDRPINTANGKKHFTNLAQHLLPPKNAAEYNQAIMDFGALQCLPISPDCASCPLSQSCVALKTNRVKCLPVRPHPLHVSRRYFHYVYVEVEGAERETVLFRRDGNDIWKGLYEPLLVETDAPCAFPDFTRLPEILKLKETATSLTLLAENVPHRLTHRLLLCNFYKMTFTQKPVFPNRNPIWIHPQNLPAYAFPRIIDRMLKNK